jgi:hypothetical protein
LKLSFERVTDKRLVREIITHPKVWRWLSDDSFPPKELYCPPDNGAVLYLLVTDTDTGEVFGLYITHPITSALWEVDHALLPTAYGPPAFAIGRAFEAWLWANTSAETVLGLTPLDNRLAIRYARRLGMQESGRIPRAICRGGEFHDFIVFTKSRPKGE